MKQLTVLLNDFELSMEGPKGKERLKIKSGYPQTRTARSLFAELGLMHLVAPYLPETITTNFGVREEFQQLITAMYQSENRPAPIFKTPPVNFHFSKSFYTTSADKVAIAYSGGKDSLWNMWWAQKRYGPNNILVVHINGLNKHNAPRERAYAEMQAQKFGFKHFRMVNLLNSSRNGGHEVMRSRDMFLAGLIIPLALEFSASQIITEGFAETTPAELFTGQMKHTEFFNATLKKLGIPVRVSWRNRKEMDVVKDLLYNRPDWLPHVCNCFAAPCYQPNCRRAWAKRATSFLLYDSQCGSCVKCRITNLGRILYDPTAQKISEQDIKTWIINTIRWTRENRVRLHDMIGGSFMRDLQRACKKYNLASVA